MSILLRLSADAEPSGRAAKIFLAAVAVLRLQMGFLAEDNNCMEDEPHKRRVGQNSARLEQQSLPEDGADAAQIQGVPGEPVRSSGNERFRLLADQPSRGPREPHGGRAAAFNKKTQGSHAVQSKTEEYEDNSGVLSGSQRYWDGPVPAQNSGYHDRDGARQENGKKYGSYIRQSGCLHVWSLPQRHETRINLAFFLLFISISLFRLIRVHQ